MKQKKDGNTTAAWIIMGILLTGFLVYNAVIAIGDLQTGRQRQADIVMAKEVLAVKHTLNLIPTGKDHYYVGVSADGQGYLIRAGESWFKKNFNADNKAKDGSLHVSAPVRSLNTKYHRDIDKLFAEMKSAFPDGYYTYIYVGFLVEDVIRFAFIAFTVICVICIAIGLKGKKIPHATPRSESVEVSDENTVKNADGNTRSGNSSDFLSDVLSGKYSGASKDSKKTSAVFRIGLVSFILAVLTMVILIFRFFR
jgi:hypothetical protein